SLCPHVFHSLIYYFLHSYYLLFFFFFFLMIPPPPISTLFPYTTLFRSVSSRSPRSTCCSTVAGTSGIRATLPSPCSCSRRRRASDRKSTRLNSSHLVISYAVFCLKKKNKLEISYISYITLSFNSIYDL